MIRLGYHTSALCTWLCPLVMLLSLATICHGYNPPVDKAGPLTVRIDGPQEVTATETPLAVKVILSNEADRQITGTLRVRVIDCWKCIPAEPISFSVAAAGEASYEFRVTAGAGTYSAHYPIHALANFDWQGQPQTAHPILILETKLPAVERERQHAAWQPMPVSDQRTLVVWELPVHRAVFHVFGGQPQTMPVAWSGSVQPSRGSVYAQRSQRLDGKAMTTIAIHPPWHSGQIGTAWIEYPLDLPETAPIELRFHTAVTPTGTGDGVTFRVRVAPLDAPAGELGDIAFERHSATKSWEAGKADLSRFAGRSVRLQLESHPGPKNNTNFDQSYWAEPTLIVGTPPEPRPFPPQSQEDTWMLGRIGAGSTVYECRVWPGSRGLLDATCGFVSSRKQLFFRGFRVRVFGQRIDRADSPVTLVEAKPESCEDGVQMRHRFASVHDKFDLVGRLLASDGALHANFWLENAPPVRPWFAPRIEEVAIDTFSDKALHVYGGAGNVIQLPESFRLSFDGHRLSTSHVGFDFAGGVSLVQAVDLPPDALEVDPDTRHYSLHAVHHSTLTFIPADTVWQAVRQYRRINGLKAAGGVERLAGRFVFDLWGGRYGESGDSLERAFRYGLTDSAVVWHNWQRWGYDYRLPEIYPPQPLWGKEDELKSMIQSCRRAKVLFALHDNYIDIYPDAEGFSYDRNIAFHEGRAPVKAWLNKGRNARSYRYRADRVEPFLKANLNLIAEQLSPTAYFIDVWSSIRPYDYWTADGQFFDRIFTRDTWGRHFAWIRQLLGDDSPQISESGHDQLIGWLDGAQTNHLRVGEPLPGDRGWCVWNIRCDDAERVPWFDAAHHDRFILHGAGYSSRYAAGLDGRMHGIYSDDYLSTEVLTGHPAMVSQPFGRDVVRKYWLTQDLMRALALRTIDNVQFVDHSLHRQLVEWSDGGRVWVNRGKSEWQVTDRLLPQYGFLAEVTTDDGKVTASIELRNGVLVEQSLSPQHLYVNARQVVGGAKRIRPAVFRVESKSPRQLDLSLAWQADDPIPDGYRPFIHFVDKEGEIAFQAGYDAKPLAERRSGRIVLTATAYLPQEVKAGARYELRVGLYSPTAGGPRLQLLGSEDGERRYRLGSIQVEGQNGDVTGVRWTPLESAPDPYLTRQNVDTKPIDFGPIVTAGGCRLTRTVDSLLLTPLPESDAVRSSFELRWPRLPWKLPPPTHVEALAENGEVLSRNPAGETTRVVCEPGIFAFRFLSETSEQESE